MSDNTMVLETNKVNSCSECPFMKQYGHMFICLATCEGKMNVATLRDEIKLYTRKRHPNCPLTPKSEYLEEYVADLKGQITQLKEELEEYE